MMLTINGRAISKKNSRNIGSRGGIIFNRPSKAYEKFEAAALQQLIDEGLTKITGIDEKRKPIYTAKYSFAEKVYIDYVIHLKGLGNQDGDNIQAGINDILQKAGILVNDRQMRKWSGLILEGAKEWKTVIRIEEL